jgi:hypothetical protein
MPTSKYLVYALKDPRTAEVRYIGRSSSGLARPRSHRNPSKMKYSENTHKGRWIAGLHKLGLDYEIEILEECSTPGDLDWVEMFWVAQMKSLGARLTNATAGGPSVSPKCHAPAARRKMSEVLRNGAAYWTGKKMPESLKVKMSRAHGGRAVIDSNGKTYSSAAEAARQTGFDESGIRHILRGTGNARSLGGGRGSKGAGLTFRFINNPCPEGSEAVAATITPKGKE